MRLTVLDEVGLIDDHAAEIKLRQPANVAVEDVVVDDENVAESIQLTPVTVNNGDAARGDPLVDFPGPVHLHHVWHDDEQWKRFGDFGRHQRLSGFTQPGLVGEQEGPMTATHSFNELGLVDHQFCSTRSVERRVFGQVHGGRTAASSLLESAEKRVDELPVGQHASHSRRGALVASKIGSHERVSQLGLLHRLGNNTLRELG